MTLLRIALGVGALTACGTSSGTDAYPLVTRVVEAMEPGRAYQLRISAAQQYRSCARSLSDGPLAALVCPESTSVATVSNALADLAPEVANAMRRRPDADALWASALLDLWSGRQDVRLLDRAIARLEEVRVRDSTTSAVLNHLAVAHSARASLRDDPRELYTAVDLIQRASALANNAPDIVFNRAVLLTVIRMDHQASDAWKLVRDRDSGWQRESADIANTTRERSTRAAENARDSFNPQSAREYLLDTVLTSWANAVMSGSATRTDSLTAQAKTIALNLVRSNGDSSMSHVASDLSLGRQAVIAAGVRAMTEGMRLYARQAFVAAGDSLGKASRSLRSEGALALADWSDNQVAAVHMAAGALDRATEGFTGVVERARRRGDRALEARALWGRGIAAARGRSMSAAEGELLAAESIFVAIGERRNAGTVRITLGEVYGFLGRSEEAANALFRGFSSRPLVGYEDLMSLSQWMSEGLPWAYTLVMRELTIVASTSAREKDVPESLLRLAQAEVIVGDSATASATLDRARFAARNVSDSLMRARLDAELDRADADLHAATDTRRALARIDSARRYFRSLPLEDAGLLLRRSRLSLALADSLQAGRDLGQALGIVRSLGVTRGGVTDRPLAATTREANRELIRMTLARGDTNGAWAQTVALGGSDNATVQPTRREPAELRFVVLPDRVLTWLGTEYEVRVAEREIPRAELTALVRRFSNLLRSGDDTVATDSLSRRLHELLLSPLEAALLAQARLDVVADGVLGELPLSFLTGDQGRVVERIAIRYVVAGRTTRTTDAGNSTGQGRLLVVNPEWSRAMFPGLEPLRWAGSETQSIVQLQTRATVLSGGTATRSTVLASLPHHAVIHFAGHARVVPENPQTSHLVLAPSGPAFSDGVLFASDVAGLSLGRVRLVVLSACGKTSASTKPTEAINGLAAAFLDAGAGAVLSGLWEIDDAITSRLMTSVHANLARGAGAEEALRQAQVALLKEPGADGHALSVAAAFVVHSRSRP